MDKKKLKRHDLVFLSQAAKDSIWQELSKVYKSTAYELLKDVLHSSIDIPAIIRRDDEQEKVAVGFVHHQRINGNRLRIAGFAAEEEIERVMDPYDVLQRKIFTRELRTKCLKAAVKIYDLALAYGIHIGVLGSVSLELVTGLPYTDADSDLDFLIQPPSLGKLNAFYNDAKEIAPEVNMDFEVEFPNGYGVKLAEVLMDTKTVLGKSLEDVKLLTRDEITQFLK